MEFDGAIDSAFDRWCNALRLLTPYNTIYFMVFYERRLTDKICPSYLLTIWFFIKTISRNEFVGRNKSGGFSRRITPYEIWRGY
ncbi:hypothetical protein C1H71_11615 [Iodobacter fluviatilis]|uniref:Uncharacterized protein n=1 Tax=Iodobacter fluviatilis TaxID=537 RepID=A0A7G3GA28_9NEIS|nr:hypothetical protein C1H71_11615 [Iodobacter fluviatilis]